MFARLRLSSHTLRIETGRYSRARLERHERVSQICNSLDIEDEYHFILICPTYVHQHRLKFISKYYIRRPSMFKFVSLMQTSKKKIFNQFK